MKPKAIVAQLFDSFDEPISDKEIIYKKSFSLVAKSLGYDCYLKIWFLYNDEIFEVKNYFGGFKKEDVLKVNEIVLEFKVGKIEVVYTSKEAKQ